MFILALFCASIVGYGYGLALLYQQEQAHTHTRYLISLVRMASVCGLAFVCSHVLHLRQIDFILLSIGFIIAFWYACAKKIGIFYARR